MRCPLAVTSVLTECLRVCWAPPEELMEEVPPPPPADPLRTDAGTVADSELYWVGEGRACRGPLRRRPRSLVRFTLSSPSLLRALLPYLVLSPSPVLTVFPDPERLACSPSQAGRSLLSSLQALPKLTRRGWRARVPLLGSTPP